jgi:glycosyltransferase involved in cell wall biosynthesis
VAAERNVYDILVKGGCLVWRSYLPNVEEIYALADCYVFPTTHKQNSIEHPLSVMEAMSCDLPVISTRFGALPELFSPGQGLYFADTEEEFISSLEAMGTDETVIRTREKVLPYSWGKVARRLENIYSGML